MGAFRAIVDAVRETRRAMETAAGICSVFVPIFQAHTATMGSPLNQRGSNRSGKKRARAGRNLSSKDISCPHPASASSTHPVISIK